MRMDRAADGPGEPTLSRLPPFRRVPKKKQKREIGHILWCLVFCVPTCTIVCLIVDRLFGG